MTRAKKLTAFSADLYGTMTDITKIIGQAVQVDVGTPGTCGYKPAQKGKVVGIIVELDNAIYSYLCNSEDITRFIVVAAKEIPSYETYHGSLTTS
jgi:hypothetical protein